jgi:hypothetical protein
MPDLVDKIQTPIDNLRVAYEYLETSQSDTQWRDRFWQLTEDTAKINLSCELGQEVGSFGSGIFANKVTDQYMNEMIETCSTLNDQEIINGKIFQEVAKDKGLDPNQVRGTGFFREFVPEPLKDEFWNRPEGNSW